MAARRGRPGWPVAALLLLAAGTAADAAGYLAGFHRVAAVAVPLDGREVTLPLPRQARPEDVRVMLVGSFKCSYNGRTYYLSGNSEAQADPAVPAPDYVHWDLPKSFAIVNAAELNGRCTDHYLLQPTPHSGRLPETVGAWVDVDQLVRELIITPSEVKQSLSGTVRLEVWQASRPGPLAAVLLAALALGAVAAVVLARRASRARMADADAILRRIERQYGPALRAVRNQRLDARQLRSQLTQLRDGARGLAARIAAFRRAAASVDREKLDAEIREAEERLTAADRDDLRAEIGSTLAAKRRLRELLANTQANDARYLLRLSQIEAAMDSAALWVTGQEARLADEGADRKAIETIHQELESLDRAIEELRVVEG